MPRPEPLSVRPSLEAILPRVRKPARYLGLERNLVRKPWESVALHVALAFPDTYEIGMSHQGSRILYHLVNRRSDALAERTYAPWPDMGEAMIRTGIPLYTLESYRPVAAFDLLGITLQSELNYINVPYLLDLAGIPRMANDRRDGDPIVLGGGPCTANPEPVANLFDAMLIGDAEAAMDAVLDTVRHALEEGTPREDLLRRLARIDGIYIPSFYQWHGPGAGDGFPFQLLDPAAPMPVQRVWTDVLDPADQPETPIVPFAEVIQDRLGMEIMRGCTQGCRFCQAGYWYRPVREHDPQVVASRMERQAAETGLEQIGLLSLSTADYSQIGPLVGRLATSLGPRRVSVSLPSLRADAFSVRLAEAVSTVRKSGFTFAPETGSDRLRRVINKTFTNADMLRAAESAFAAGWNLIKVYAMIGLPTETDEDLEELVSLTRELAVMGRRVRGRKAEIKVSVGCFVPKAWTPFQWEPFCGVEELERRIALLRRGFRRIRGARLTWNDPREAALEVLLSRGDRRLAAVICRARDLGALFDGWNEHLDLSAWNRALAEHGIDMEAELGPRELADPLPWDIIDAGVRKGYLKAELRRARKETATEDCKWGHCYRCGIPGNGEDIKLAAATIQLSQEDKVPSRPGERPPALTTVRSPAAAQRPIQPEVYRRYRFVYAKCGDARFLSHRNVMDALERALRGADVPVHYTEGYNPHIRLSMGPALPLGTEGLAESFDVACTAALRQHHLRAINDLLPEGLEILDATALLPGAPSLGKLSDAARYRITAFAKRPWPSDPKELPGTIRDAIRRWEIAADGTLRLELALRMPGGQAPSLKAVLLALDIPEEDIPALGITREAVLLRRQKSNEQDGEPA